MNGSTTPDGLRASDALDAALYPDLIEAGGLAGALLRVAGESGIDLGAVEPADQWGRSAFVTARLDSERGPVGVLLGLDSRRFSLALGSSRSGHGWAEGGTADLTEAARAIDAWRRGVRLRALTAEFPFLEYPPLSQGFEDGTQVETQWDLVLADPDPDYGHYRELLAALHAVPEVSKLFPFFSMYTLRLAKDGVDPSLGEVIVKWSPGANGFIVRSSSEPQEQFAADPVAAVERTRSLVADLGPYGEDADVS